MTNFKIHPAHKKSPLCRSCALEHSGTGFARPEGTGAIRVLIVGEALGPNEARDGLPFRPYAPAGSVLERAFRMCGYTRDQFVIFNIVNCLPPNMELAGAPYEIEAAQHCRVHLLQVIRQFKPKCILALGAVALRSLTGHAGKKQSIEHLRGFALFSPEPELAQIPIVSSFHPSYIVRGAWNVLPVLCRDMKYAVQVAKNGFTPPAVEFYEQAGLSELEWLMDRCSMDESLPVSIDFETEVNLNVFEDVQLMNAMEELYGEEDAKKKLKKKDRIGTEQPITQVNISIKENESFVFQASQVLMEGCAKLLATPNPKLTFNGWNFDGPVGAWNGMPIEGVHHDAIWCLRGDNLVALWGGGWRRIDDIVNKKLESKIIGMDDFGHPIKLSILKWHRTEVPNQEWIHIKSDAIKNPLVVTPDHEVWTVERCWVQAGELRVGEHLKIPKLFNEDLFMGAMLGDAYINKESRSFHVRHGDKQTQYIQAKAEAFGAKVYTAHAIRTNKKTKHEIQVHFCVSVSRDWHSKFYKGKQRLFVAPPSFSSLAIWYQDDGCFSRNKRNNKEYGNGRVLFAVNRFQAQKEEVLKYFRSKFGIDVELIRNGKVIRISKDSLTRFFEAICKFVHPSMDYKLASHYRGRYNGWMKSDGFAISRITAITEAPHANQTRLQNTRYCLSVDHPTQRFFVMGGLVHNCFHHLWPDLPGKKGKVQGEMEGSLANLQFASSMYSYWMPWKHLVDERPEFYGCHDSAATLMLFNSLKRDMEALRYGTSGPTIWDGYMSMVYDVQPILARMKERGLPVNKEKMLVFLKSVVNRQREVGREIQKVVPDELRTCSPKAGYAKKPVKKCEMCDNGIVRDDDQLIIDHTCSRCNGEGHVSKHDSLILRDFTFPAETGKCKCNKIRKKNVEKWMEVSGAEFDDKGRLRAPDPDCVDCGGVGWVDRQERVETRWCRLLPFNPNSPPQMRSYAAFHHHKVPKNSKKKYAMDKETVEKLAKSTGDPLYKECVRFREFEKMRTYALGWMPGDDGCVHSTGSFFPATGQLSYTDPNLQTAPNVGKYGILAEEFRDGIEAPDGYVLIEADMKSYHAQTLGFEAGCDAYIRLAKIDIHSYLATRMIKAEHSEYALEWSDGELKEWLSWYRKNFHLKDGTPFKKIRDKQAKPGILGYGFGLGAGKLYRLNEDSFASEKEARLVLDTLDDTFPEVKKFRDTTPMIAKRQGSKLISRYGCVRWFWDLQSWDAHRQEYVHGGDWEKAIAFLPANVAFCHMKLAMKRLEDSGAAERFGLILNIHDALLWRTRCDLVSEALHVIKTEMERPSEYMLFADGTGLSVEVETKVGRTWNKMEEVGG